MLRQSVALILKLSLRLWISPKELELVASASARLLAHSGIPHKVPDAVLELLVRTFRDPRANGEKKTSMDTLTAIMSTAEAVERGSRRRRPRPGFRAESRR